MQVTAIAKNIKTSPQKVRLVVDQIKKMKPQEAIDILSFTNKRASIPLKKVMLSAVANAKHNFGIDQNALAIKSIQVGQGQMSKRYRPVSRGRAHSILRRTSHITVVLEGEKSQKVTNVSEVSQPKAGRPLDEKVAEGSNVEKPESKGGLSGPKS